MAQVPNSLAIPSGAPSDLYSMSLFLTVAFNSLQQFVGLTATILNALGGYSFLVKPNGNLYIVGPNGTETLIATP